MTNHAWMLIVVAAILWSLDGLLRRSLYGVSPLIVVFWEHALGSLLLLPFVIRSLHKELPTLLNKKVFSTLAAVSLFSGVLGTLFYTTALMRVQYIPFSVVVLLQKLQPLFAVLSARMFLKERLTRSFMLWASGAFVGAYLVTFKNLAPVLSTGTNTAVAALLAIGAALMWGSSTPLSKLGISYIGYRQATAVRFFMTAIFSCVLILFFRLDIGLPAQNPHPLLVLLAISFSTGLVSLLIYYRGLAQTSAMVSALCELAWPVSALLIDIFIFKYVPSVTQVAGALLIAYSVYRVTQGHTVKDRSKLYGGIVQKGDGVGRHLGFRTLNLQASILEGGEFVKGVYTAEVLFNGKSYGGVLYWGPKKNRQKVYDTLEIHLFQFKHLIYGEKVLFRVGTFIRKPIRFESRARLLSQLKKDIRAAHRLDS